MPAATPVTIPVEASTDAVPAASVVQLPPASPDEDKVDVAATHTVVVPLIEPAFGAGLTVTVVLAEEVPHELLTV